MAAPNWDDFKLFDGPATLDKTIFSDRPMRQSVERFKQWIIDLRGGITNPNAPTNRCGIPDQHVDTVTHLLDTFFPFHVDGTGVYTGNILFVSHDDPNNDVDYTMMPVSVTSVNNPEQNILKNFDITDGPSALGFIFSVQIPLAIKTNALVPTYVNYGMPLLAMYSKWLYIAFSAQKRQGRRKKWIQSSIPFMSCAMYLENANQNILSIILGSTYICGFPNDPLDAAPGEGLLLAVDRWRKENVLCPGPNQYNAARELPTAPQARWIAADAFWKGFVGVSPAIGGDRQLDEQEKTANNVVREKIPRRPWPFQKIVSDEQADTAWTAAVLALKKDFPTMVALAKTQVELIESLDQALRQLVFDLIDLTSEPGWETNPAMIVAIKAVLKFYYIPHLFPPKATDPTAADPTQTEQQVPITSTSGIVVEGLLDTLLLACKDSTFALLQQVLWWVERRNPKLEVLGFVPWGRCAETYPVTLLLPRWTPTRVLPDPNDPNPNPPPPVVRGFAIQNRRLKVTDSLSQSFSQQTLNGLHNAETLYRLPCANCQKLLRIFDIPVGATAYDTDLLAATNGVTNQIG